MDNGFVEVMTAPSLELEAYTNLKVKIASNEDIRKEAATFSEDYDSVSKVIPANEQGLRKALVELALGDYEQAEGILTEESSTEAKVFLAQVQLAKGDVRGAKASLAEAIKGLGDAQSALLVEVALTASSLKDHDSLKAALDGAKEGDNGYVLIKALSDELSGDVQSAIDGLMEASEVEGAYQGQALFHLAKLQDRWGDDELALETYEKINSLGYGFEESFVNAGIILEDKGEYAKALAYYEKALKINPGNRRVALYHADAEACLDMFYDERQQRQDVKTFEILNIPISDFELSVRSRNCLSKMNIFTLKDLITKTEQELLSYKNFGETSLKEIRAMLAKKGLHLGMTRVEEQPLADRIKMNAQLYSEEREYSLDELDTSIEDLDLSYRTKSALHKMGFESLRDITMRTGTDLESNPNFSAACLQELNALLEEKGLSYRPATSSGRPEEATGTALLGNEEESIFEYD
jgi:DNA-directed RNA polymerase subunit alpha